MIQKIIKLISSHKIIAVLVLLALSYGGYWGYKKMTDTSGQATYLLAQIKKGTITASVSGSGQVSALNQIDIKSKASGEALWVNVVNSQEVYAGAVITQIDDRDAKKAVRDAEIAFEQTKLDLEKMKGLKTDLGSLRGVKEKASDSLVKSYDDGFNTIADMFLTLPDVMAGFHDILFTSAVNVSQWNINYFTDSVTKYDEKGTQYRDAASSAYEKARGSYDAVFSAYKNASRFSDGATVESLIGQGYDATKDIAEALKNANNLIQFYKDTLVTRNIKPVSAADTYLTSLNSYIGKTNALLLSLLSAKNAIQTNKETFVGTDFDIADQEIKLSQAQNTLDTAKENLADYAVRAPFAGTIAKLNVKKADSVSNGSAIATLITKRKIAELSFNEVDVAKVKVGQKSTLTFDAVPDLSISGEVAEIDAIGTVAQGVVSYTVKITFDTQDERVKTAMSVSAAIITDVKTDVLMAPVSAVKSQGQEQYVEVKNDANAPARAPVQTGIASDEFIEIISGVKEGDNVVSGTISAQTTSATTQQQSGGLRIPGLTGQGGGAGRAGGR